MLLSLSATSSLLVSSIVTLSTKSLSLLSILLLILVFKSILDLLAAFVSWRLLFLLGALVFSFIRLYMICSYCTRSCCTSAIAFRLPHCNTYNGNSVYNVSYRLSYGNVSSSNQAVACSYVRHSRMCKRVYSLRLSRNTT